MSAKKVIIIGPAHPYRGGIANFNNALAIIISYPYFKSYEIVQNFNHYGESSLPHASLGAIIFSLVSVSILLYLLYSNSIRVKQEN